MVQLHCHRDLFNMIRWLHSGISRGHWGGPGMRFVLHVFTTPVLADPKIEIESKS